MGSNEIIIDGVNVAECKFFESKAQVMQCHMQAITERCKDNNCYFKQLQRAKAEKQEKVLKMAEAEIEIEKLQAENKRLKSLINTHLTTFDKCCVNGLIMSNNMSEVLNEQNDR